MGENSPISSIVAGGYVGAVGAVARWVIGFTTRRFGGAFRQVVRDGW